MFVCAARRRCKATWAGVDGGACWVQALLKLALLAGVGYFCAMAAAHWASFKVPVLFIYFDVPFYEYQDKIISFCAFTCVSVPAAWGGVGWGGVGVRVGVVEGVDSFCAQSVVAACGTTPSHGTRHHPPSLPCCCLWWS
jgi:hypothetical protein